MKRRERFAIAALIALTMGCSASAARIELRTDSASCTVETVGARILSFAVGGEEQLWNDSPLQLTANDWAHGGIPTCWPWFGVATNGLIHGTAWRSEFKTIRRNESKDRSEAELLLETADAKLTLRLALTDALTLEMETLNTGTNEFRFSAGFHPYLRVAERDAVRVEGVDGLSYEDDPSCPVPASGTWSGPLPITNNVDRIFSLGGAAPATLRLVDPAQRRTIIVESVGADAANVWNPGAAKLCPGNVPGDSWRRFVCVEPILVGGKCGFVSIAPGERRSLKMSIRREKTR